MIIDALEQVTCRLRRILDPRLPVGRGLSWSGLLLVTLLGLVLIPSAARRVAVAKAPMDDANAPATSDDDSKAGSIVENDSADVEIAGEKSVDPIQLSGRVLDVNGAPTANARIDVSGWTSTIDHWTSSTRTAADGTFHLDVRVKPQNLPGIVISATHPDQTKRGYRRFPLDSRAQDYQVPAELLPSSEQLEIRLSPLRSARIRVTNAAGEPIEDARAAIDLGFPVSLTGKTTDASGIVSFDVPENERIESAMAWKDAHGMDFRVYSLPRGQARDIKVPPPAFPADSEEELILTGALPLTVRVADDDGRAIEGVRILPFMINKEPDAVWLSLHFGYRGEFSQVSNVNGTVTFPWLPAWDHAAMQFTTRSSDYASHHLLVRPATDGLHVDMVLHPRVPIRGQVRYEDERPAEGIDVVAKYSSVNTVSTRSDAEGRYELLVPPDEPYMVIVSDQKWASAPQVGFAISKDEPLEDKDFTLRQATRVHGRLTNESSRNPIIGAYVTVYYSGESTASWEPVEPPASADAPRRRRAPYRFLTRTDDRGQFEFLLGDGQYTIFPPGSGRRTFGISGEREIEMELWAPITAVAPEREFVGIVQDQATGKPLPRARIEVKPAGVSGAPWTATTERDGSFRFNFQSNASKYEVFAVSHDSKRVAFTTLEYNDERVTLSLVPVASAQGRLFTTDTGEPWPAQVINFELSGTDTRSLSGTGGQVTTSADGTFQIDFLVPDREYSLYIEATDTRAYRPPRAELKTFSAASGEPVELGDVRAPLPRSVQFPPMLEQRVDHLFDASGTPIQRYQRELAKADEQSLLIVFGVPEDPRVQQFMEARFYDHAVREAIDQFRLVAIPTDPDRRGAAAELAQSFGESLEGDRGDFLLVWFDPDGNKIAVAESSDFALDNRLSHGRLLYLLRSQLPTP